MPRAPRSKSNSEERYAQEGEDALASFNREHGNISDLAKRLGRDEEYAEKLGEVFANVTGMVQIVTKGDPDAVDVLIRDPNTFFDKLLSDDNGMLRGFLAARALHEVISRPSRKDPLEWAKFLMEVVAYNQKALELPKKVEGHVRTATHSTEDVVDQLLRGVEKPRGGTEEGGGG